MQHDGTASMSSGSWRKFVGAGVGAAIDAFVREHGYTPAQDTLNISVSFTKTELQVRVSDIYNLECK